MIRRERLENSVNHERWLVSYADLVTLLFAFFVVMYSVSHVSESKYHQLSSVLEQVFTTSQTQSSEQLPSPTPQHLSVLEQVEINVLEALSDFINSKDAIVEGTESWVEIELNANLLFDSGSEVPTRRAHLAFAKIAELLAPLGNEVSVAGHTDNQPIHTQQFANNWQLSTARAIQVVNVLVNNGVAPERLSAIGYGEFRPVADNNSEHGRLLNRRVVLRVSKDSPATQRQRSSGRNIDNILPANLNPVRLEDGGLLFSSDPSLKYEKQPIQ